MAGLAFFASAIFLPLFAILNDLFASIILLSVILGLIALHAAGKPTTNQQTQTHKPINKSTNKQTYKLIIGYLSNPGDLSRPHAGNLFLYLFEIIYLFMYLFVYLSIYLFIYFI
jgi:hypothetical protein